ncbi:NAD(P)-dependent oxidoreductase [Neobacillus terrae]|uniref:NAD(P)-dependent oxidoreductase n=1 Tax=Neobacillus terrae TaxID=3034837 RepID=UPI00140ACD6B|nr:NAD(P)H-binding protein [Neobacillus terrae]NHM31780.1 NAD(P)H-binding protein [Neobacillus terrae]
MNICLLGATGRVGSIILENALKENHSVQALVRDLTKITGSERNLKVLHGSVLNAEDLSDAMANTDVVISALNTGGNQTLSQSMPFIIKSMKDQGIKRIITLGTAGILQARSEPALYRFQSSESRRTSTRDAEDHLLAYLLLKDSGLIWTVVCPTYLPVGERIGTYRFEKNMLPDNPSSISIFDTADFTYCQLFSNEFLNCRVGLTY